MSFFQHYQKRVEEKEALEYQQGRDPNRKKRRVNIPEPWGECAYCGHEGSDVLIGVCRLCADG